MITKILPKFSDGVHKNILEANPARANAMVSAIDTGNLSELKKLLEEANHKNPVIYKTKNNTPLTALHYSARQGKLEIFKSISNNLANLQPKAIGGARKGATPLHYAAIGGHLNIGKSNSQFKISPLDGVS